MLFVFVILTLTAAEEVRVVIENIKNMERKNTLVRYSPSKLPMLISLGKYDGIFTYRGYSFGGFIPAAMKEFVEWKEMVYYWQWNRFSLRRDGSSINQDGGDEDNKEKKRRKDILYYYRALYARTARIIGNVSKNLGIVIGDYQRRTSIEKHYHVV